VSAADLRRQKGYVGAGGEIFCPAGTRILVKPNEARSTTESGRIHIPDPAREQPNRGVVLAIGHGAFHPQHGKWVDPRDYIELGDQVIFSKYAGTEIEIDGLTMVVLSTDDLIAVVLPSQQVPEGRVPGPLDAVDYYAPNYAKGIPPHLERNTTESDSPAKTQE
jgi:chaperonin GroES